MQLGQGTRLGPYEILEPLGRGGMGEVYRARDTHLDRFVAVKILPALFSSDPDRLARFEREARTLASLNHPNIAQIYGTERAEGIHALAMELVEGEDLAQRLGRGAIPLDEALAIARQLADALEVAHEQGIVHRDLKPANVQVRPDSVVKVLDFGLAKAMGADGTASGTAGAMNSPTFTSPALTQMGVILGTAAYMAPEQARGKPVDRRADIWAFGCLLYEMITGRRPFGGEDVSLTLSSVLKDPVDFAALPRDVPPSIQRLIRRCLEKDPRKRLSSIGDARLELDDARGEPSAAQAIAPVARARWRAPLAWIATGALVGAFGVGALLVSANRRTPVGGVVWSQISLLPASLWLAGNRAFAIDPGGTEVVFSAIVNGEQTALFRRRLDDEHAVRIPDTENAAGPFFSGDGRWLAFVQNGRLKKLLAAGGAVIDVTPASRTQGGTFAPDGAIILNLGHGEGLVRIPPDGSAPTIVTTVERDKAEAGHHWPHMLPDGKHVLVTVEVDGKPYSEARIMALSLETGARHLLIDGGSDARYLPTGHILYWRQQSLWLVPFDMRRLELAGPAVRVVPDVMNSEPNGQAHAAVSGNGTLIFIRGRDTQAERGLMLVDRSGVAHPLTTERRAYEAFSLSPDGQRLVLTIIAANDSLWTMETGRASLTRITFDAENSEPVWSPDGTRLAFARYRGGEPRQLFVMPADGSGAPTQLRQAATEEIPASWTGSGNILAFKRPEEGAGDIWTVPVDQPGEARPFLATRFAERFPTFSPDGRWIAYDSDESGRFEVYVRPFPGPGQKRLVSSDGGTEPRWRRDGREIFYRRNESVMVAEVAPGPDLRTSLPRELFRGPYLGSEAWPMWDVTPDGTGFVMVQDFARPPTALTMVQNWFASLPRSR